MTFSGVPAFEAVQTSFRPFVELPVRTTVSIVRNVRRGRCVNCQRRRELYRVVLQANGGDDATEARCAECWGIAR